MDLIWLEDFLAIAEEGGFSRAAERRHVTQPALSRRIKVLEEWLGTPLIERRSHTLTLTPAGEAPRTRLDLTRPGTHPAFDDLGETTTRLGPGDEVGYTFAGAEATTLYTVTVASPGTFAWRLDGRDDDGEWRPLDYRPAEEFRWGGQTRPFLLASTASCLAYRLVADGDLPLVQLELLAEQ